MLAFDLVGESVLVSYCQDLCAVLDGTSILTCLTMELWGVSCLEFIRFLGSMDSLTKFEEFQIVCSSIPPALFSSPSGIPVLCI